MLDDCRPAFYGHPMQNVMLPLVEARGDDRQRGVAQGLAYRSRLGAMYRSLADLPLGLDWMGSTGRGLAVRLAVQGAGRIYLPLHRRLLAAHAGGRYLRVLKGLAEGFDVGAEELYGFHAFEVESGILGYRMGCTALAVSPTGAASGTARLAYNHDFPAPFRPHLVLRRNEPRGPGVARSLSITYELQVGSIAGVNEHGLAATVNQAYARTSRRGRPALLPTLLVQDCLDHCRSVAEAVARARRLPVPVGSLLTLVDAAGERAVVELAPQGHAVRRPVEADPLMATFNGYRCVHTQAQEVPHGALGTGLASGYDLHLANVERERRLAELLEDHRGPWTDEQVHGLLSDHDGGTPGGTTLCRHDPALGGDTILSVLLDPTTRSVRSRRGFPCEGAWGDPVTL